MLIFCFIFVVNNLVSLELSSFSLKLSLLYLFSRQQSFVSVYLVVVYALTSVIVVDTCNSFSLYYYSADIIIGIFLCDILVSLYFCFYYVCNKNKSTCHQTTP